MFNDLPVKDASRTCTCTFPVSRAYCLYDGAKDGSGVIAPKGSARDLSSIHTCSPGGVYIRRFNATDAGSSSEQVARGSQPLFDVDPVGRVVAVAGVADGTSEFGL